MESVSTFLAVDGFPYKLNPMGNVPVPVKVTVGVAPADVVIDIAEPLPFDAFGSVKVFPKWTKSDKITMDYFLTVPLPKGFNFSTFGEVSLNNDPEPIEFTYGEASLDWSKGPLTFGYNPAFIGNKDLTPKVQHRFAASYNF